VWDAEETKIKRAVEEEGSERNIGLAKELLWDGGYHRYQPTEGHFEGDEGGVESKDERYGKR